jgi:hypothetical protein
MRLTSKKDKSYYVYGLSEDSFYIKDTSLPQKFRYGYMNFDAKSMSYDEQKHYLFNKLNLILNKSASYDEFKRLLKESGIGIKEHVNSKGIYGLTYSVMDTDIPLFRLAEIYLTRAEANYRLGNTTDALADAVGQQQRHAGLCIDLPAGCRRRDSGHHRRTQTLRPALGHSATGRRT